jgi:hypothetical protein
MSNRFLSLDDYFYEHAELVGEDEPAAIEGAVI